MPILKDEIVLDVWQSESALVFHTTEDLLEWSQHERRLWPTTDGVPASRVGWHQQVNAAASMEDAAIDLHETLTRLDSSEESEEDRENLRLTAIQRFSEATKAYRNRLAIGTQVTSANPLANTISALFKDDPTVAWLALTAARSDGDKTLANFVAQGGFPWSRVIRALMLGIPDLNDKRMSVYSDSLAVMTERYSRIASDVTEMSRRWNDTFSELSTSARDRSAGIEQEWKERVATNDIEWKAALAAYDEKMALAAPTTYWASRAKAAQKSAGIYALAFSAIIACFAFSFFVWGMPHLAAVPANASVIVAVLPILVPSFLGVWILRVLGRLLSESLSLEQDAREREVMVKTFLALMRDEVRGEALVTNDDRLLILHSLFRPSSVSGADDSPPVHWFDILSKKMGGPKP